MVAVSEGGGGSGDCERRHRGCCCSGDDGGKTTLHCTRQMRICPGQSSGALHIPRGGGDTMSVTISIFTPSSLAGLKHVTTWPSAISVRHLASISHGGVLVRTAGAASAAEREQCP